MGSKGVSTRTLLIMSRVAAIALLHAVVHTTAEDAWRTITMYDVLNGDCSADVAEKNLGDVKGDMFFMFKDKYLGYACPKYCKKGLSSLTCHMDPSLFDCINAESQSSNLVVRKIEVEVKGHFGNYKLCNAEGEKTCKYFCAASKPWGYLEHGRVGQQFIEPGTIDGPHPIPGILSKDVDYWAYNLAGKMSGGSWFSLEKAGEGKFWRNPKIVKVIDADCQGKWVDQVVESKGQGCFSSCPAANGRLDTSSECYVKCYYDTILGTGSHNSTKPSDSLDLSILSEAWTAGFSSEELSKGGCPSISQPRDTNNVQPSVAFVVV